MLPTPVFLPEEFHAQRSLAVCSPWDRKESDTTKRLTLSFHFQSPGTSLMKNSSWNFMEGNYGNLDEAVFFLVFQISLTQLGAFLSKYRNSIIFLQNQNLFVFYLFRCCCCCLGKEMFLLKKKNTQTSNYQIYSPRKQRFRLPYSSALPFAKIYSVFSQTLGFKNIY